MGETVRELKLDALMVLNDGMDAQDIVQGASGVPTECFATHAELVAGLKEFVKQGDRILFKAAHSVGLDRVVSQFREEFSRIV